MFYDLGLIMVTIPMFAVAGGRWWPFLQVLPLTAIPIAGKTIRALSHANETASILPQPHLVFTRPHWRGTFRS